MAQGFTLIKVFPISPALLFFEGIATVVENKFKYALEKQNYNVWNVCVRSAGCRVTHRHANVAWTQLLWTMETFYNRLRDRAFYSMLDQTDSVGVLVELKGQCELRRNPQIKKMDRKERESCFVQKLESSTCLCHQNCEIMQNMHW